VIHVVCKIDEVLIIFFILLQVLVQGQLQIGGLHPGTNDLH